MDIVVYSKQGCPFCSLLKLELSKRGLRYVEFDLTDDEARKTFYENTGTKTVPQVFLTDAYVNLTQPSGTHIGGYTDVRGMWEVLESSQK